MSNNKTVWILFGNGDTRLSKLLTTGFQHVRLVSCDKYNYWIFNPTVNGLQFAILAKEPTWDELAKIFTIVKVVYKDKKKYKFMKLFQHVNCSTFIKYLMGIRFRGITPYQLYKDLVKNIDNCKFDNIKSIEVLNGQN